MEELEKSLPYYDQIYHSIREMIFNGILKPGERIFEAKIARDFNISRSPVREAVKILEKEGLLVIDEKSRITVFQPTAREFKEIYECRIMLEALAAQLTARLASRKELEELGEVLAKTRMYLAEKDEQNRDAVIALNARFHDLITQFSQNRRLQQQLHDLRSLCHYYRVINFNGENRDWTIYKEHEEIYQHLVNRDEKNASLAMSKHISNDLRHFKKMILGSNEKETVYHTPVLATE